MYSLSTEHLPKKLCTKWNPYSFRVTSLGGNGVTIANRITDDNSCNDNKGDRR